MDEKSPAVKKVPKAPRRYIYWGEKNYVLKWTSKRRKKRRIKQTPHLPAEIYKNLVRFELNAILDFKTKTFFVSQASIATKKLTWPKNAPSAEKTIGTKPMESIFSTFFQPIRRKFRTRFLMTALTPFGRFACFIIT